MIGPEHEEARSGEGARYFDAVAMEFADPERDVFGLACMAWWPNAGASAALTLLVVDGETSVIQTGQSAQGIESWSRASVDGLEMATEAPLERWRLVSQSDGIRLSLGAAAASLPLDLTDEAGEPAAGPIGISRYEQLISVEGVVNTSDEERALHGTGRRVHAWGADRWDDLAVLRSLFAATSDGRAITVASARMRGSEGHHDEARSAHRLGGDEEPLPFAEVRLSSVYGPEGLPRKASLELYVEGEELPRRAAGEALWAATIPLGGNALTAAFLRWSVEGTPAFGGYYLFRRS
jgi:hypothetical protein